MKIMRIMKMKNWLLQCGDVAKDDDDHSYQDYDDYRVHQDEDHHSHRDDDDYCVSLK